MVHDVYLVAAEGGEPRRLTQGGGSVGGRPGRGRTRLAIERYAGVFDDPKHSKIALVDAASGAITVLTASLDRNCTTYPGMREPLWDGRTLSSSWRTTATHTCIAWLRRLGEPQLLVGGERVVTGLDVAAGRLVFAVSEPAHLSELYDGGPWPATTPPPRPGAASPRSAPRSRPLASSSSPSASRRSPPTAAKWTRGSCGPRLRAGQALPDLLNIHGGPYGQ